MVLNDRSLQRIDEGSVPIPGEVEEHRFIDEKPFRAVADDVSMALHTLEVHADP
jgi:hypothetical protein